MTCWWEIAPCLHYLKSTGKQLCLLINFGTPKIQIKRTVNNFKLSSPKVQEIDQMGALSLSGQCLAISVRHGPYPPLSAMEKPHSSIADMHR